MNGHGRRPQITRLTAVLSRGGSITALMALTALMVSVVVTLLVVIGWSTAASAHTDFAGSDPADGATATGALSTISVSFTNPAEPAGDGFRVVGADGNPIVPTSLDQTDGRVFKLNFEPALADGSYTVTWNVRAGDAHPINGTFTFSVAGAAPVTTPPTVPEATTTVAPVTPATTPPTIAPSTPTVAPDVAVPPSTVAPTDSTAPVLTGSTAAGHSGATAGRIGSLLTFSGTIVSVGILVALAFVVRVNRDELRALITWAQLGGLVIVTGGLVEMANLREIAFGSWSEMFGTKPGIGVALKLIGGILITIGLRVGPEPRAHPERSEPTDATTVLWVPLASALGIAGGALVLASFWFDGHTVSRGPWIFHSAVNLVHVGAAAAWAGGVFTMAVLAWMRRHSTHTGGVAKMIVRFSSVATISLIAIVLAGIAMTFLVTDGLGDVVSTEWGRVLLIKVAAVAIAAGIGAYNRFTLVPLITAQPADDEVNARLRTTLSAEAAVLGVVVVLSAVLVAAAI